MSPALGTAERPLRAHFRLHVAALALLAAGILADNGSLVLAAAAAGTVGALAYAGFFATAVRRMTASIIDAGRPNR